MCVFVFARHTTCDAGCGCTCVCAHERDLQVVYARARVCVCVRDCVRVWLGVCVRAAAAFVSEPCVTIASLSQAMRV